MSEFDVVEYTPELEDELVALWTAVFQMPEGMTRAYLEWKYMRNPYLAPLLMVARERTGGIVGARGFYGTCWRTGRVSTVIPAADDFGIAAEHRTTGLATSINRVGLEALVGRGHEFVLSLSGGRVTVLQSLAMGWKSVGPMEPVARVPWSRETHRRLQTRALEWARGVWEPGRFSRRLYHLLYPTRQPDTETSFDRLDSADGDVAAEPGARIAIETAPRPDAMAELVDRLHVDGRIRHVRDPAFFGWRFEDPRREYRFLLYERGGRIDGYLVLARYRWYRAPVLPLHISDWEGTTPEIRGELLEKALSLGGFDAGLGAWTASLPADSKRALDEAGFKPTKLDLRARGLPCVLLKKLVPNGEWSIAGEPAVDQSKWDVRLVDSMHG